MVGGASELLVTEHRQGSICGLDAHRGSEARSGAGGGPGALSRDSRCWALDRTLRLPVAPADAATPLRTIVEDVPGSTGYRYGDEGQPRELDGHA